MREGQPNRELGSSGMELPMTEPPTLLKPLVSNSLSNHPSHPPPHTPSPSHSPFIFTKSSPSPVSNSIPLHPIKGPVIGVLKFLALTGRDVARLMTWTSALAIGMILGGLTLVSPGFWRWIRRYAVRLTGALLILIGITSLAVCWMNALAANPTAVWFLHSSAVEEVGPWWMLLATVGVWAVLDVSRSYLPSLFTNHLRPWLTPFTMAPTIQTNSTNGDSDRIVGLPKVAESEGPSVPPVERKPPGPELYPLWVPPAPEPDPYGDPAWKVKTDRPDVQKEWLAERKKKREDALRASTVPEEVERLRKEGTLWAAPPDPWNVFPVWCS